MTTLDLTKPVQQKDGTPVRIYSHKKENYRNQIHGEYQDPNGEWHIRCWEPNGKWGASPDFDLANVPSRIQKEIWVNIYPSELYKNKYFFYEAYEDAARNRASNCIATARLEIDCEEGEGL